MCSPDTIKIDPCIILHNVCRLCFRFRLFCRKALSLNPFDVTPSAEYATAESFQKERKILLQVGLTELIAVHQ